MRRKHRLAEHDFNAKGYGRLATYNAERGRGIVHTPAYVAQMAELQERFNREMRADAAGRGYIIVEPRA